MAIVVSGLLALRTYGVRSRRLRMHVFNRRLPLNLDDAGDGSAYSAIHSLVLGWQTTAGG